MAPSRSLQLEISPELAEFIFPLSTGDRGYEALPRPNKLW